MRRSAQPHDALDRVARWGTPQGPGRAARSNWLRAAVLGANDGLVSTAGLVVGVAATTAVREPILTAGLAGMVAGTVAMALGEYVSVSSQRDSERAQLTTERQQLIDDPAGELAELIEMYERKGLSARTARLVATELSSHDAFAAHVDAELALDPHALTNPWHAAGASAAAFTVGALLPVLAVLVSPAGPRIPVTVLVVLVALGLTGALSAQVGGGHRGRAVVRVFCGGAIAMAVTFGIGLVLGSVVP